MDNFLALAGAVAVVLAAIAALAAVVTRALRQREAEATHDEAAEVAALGRLQAETAAQVKAMCELLASGQAEHTRAVNERLDSVTHHLNQSMTATRQHTTDHLQKLNERLAVIDGAHKSITELAQKHIGELASQVTSLGAVLSNKQARGAFGQGRMEAIIADALPKDAYAFQPTLANGKRPDCAVFLPDGRPLVIDAKFPLEAITALRDAKDDDARKAAAARLRSDMTRHIVDIADKYLVPGETQDLALMFVPSESVFAELHDGFDDVVQKAYRARVVLVSPALLMLAVQVVQQIQKDARMREAADLIHAEVGNLLDDLKRMQERVVKLQAHFGQANEDVRQILISAEKIEKRGAKIREVDFADDAAPSDVIPAPMRPKLQVGE